LLFRICSQGGFKWLDLTMWMYFYANKHIASRRDLFFFHLVWHMLHCRSNTKMVVSMKSNSNCGCCSVYSWLNSHHSINFNVWHAWASTPLLHKTCKNLSLSFPNYLFFTSFITHHHHYTHITNELMKGWVNGCFFFLVFSPIVVIVF